MGSQEKLASNNVSDSDELLQGNLEVGKLMFAYMDSLVLRSAVELGIADIIHSHGQGQPMSIPHIASKIDSPTIHVRSLAQIMRALVRKNVFSVDLSGDEPLYGLTTTSKYLVRDQGYSFANLVLLITHPTIIAAWQQIGPSIKEGVTPFVKAHGDSFWEMASKNPEFNKTFNSGMASSTVFMIEFVVKGYKDGFSKLEGTLVDIGGGIGKFITKIVENHPHIKGINFDLPHVVANAPQHPGVTHVGGDMLKEIPPADNVIIKSVLLDWADEDCIKILKNCKKAVSKKQGKVIIVDIVLHPYREMMFDDEAIAVDLMMMTHYGGKTRTEDEWKVLLNESGFTHFNVIPLQTTHAIIEAFP